MIHKCAICDLPYHGYGNNAYPVKPLGERCCDDCNAMHVIPARIAAAYAKPTETKKPS